MRGDINKQMTKGIDSSAVVVAFITKRYTSKVDGEGAAGMDDVRYMASQIASQGLSLPHSLQPHDICACTELQVRV